MEETLQTDKPQPSIQTSTSTTRTDVNSSEKNSPLASDCTLRPFNQITSESPEKTQVDNPSDQQPPSINKACIHCQNILDNWHQVLSERVGQFSHWESKVELEKSASSGCGMCVQFRNGFESRRSQVMEPLSPSDYMTLGFEPQPLKPSQVGVSTTTFRDAEGHIRERVWTLNMTLSYIETYSGEAIEHKGKAVLVTECYIINLFPAAAEALVFDSRSALLGTTEDSLPTIKKWLNECLTTHYYCQPDTDQPSPTRLLFLENNALRISLADERSEATKYATLSHCWGKHPFQTLTQSNLQKFRDKIPLDILSKTFQEAVRVTKALGFEYLWIDSLCIVQDDPSDWAKESTLMRSVYSGSSLNIAASDAADGTGGCFFPRESNWRCQVQAMTASGVVLHDCFPENIKTSLQKSALAERGWVLQERLLPYRTAHFTKPQVYWECEEATFCESLPEGLPLSMYGDLHVPRRPFKARKWPEIVQLYASTKVSFNKDKLVAISGLARLIEATSGDEYVAGMWGQDLELYLCWYVATPTKRLLSYTAPSWSWASLDTFGAGFVSRPLDDRDSIKTAYVSVRKTYIQNTTGDTFGQISSASIRLRCKHFMHVRMLLDRREVDIGEAPNDSMDINGTKVPAGLAFDEMTMDDYLSKDKAGFLRQLSYLYMRARRRPWPGYWLRPQEINVGSTVELACL